jgi:RNA-directed DNA polymerase
MDKGVFNTTDSGTPQGGIVSPLLANIALHGLESALGIKYYRKKDKKGNVTWTNKSNRTLIRYADDFVIMCESKEDAYKAKEETELWLKNRGLTLSPEKTRITETSEGFNFLGWNFRHYKVTTTKSGIKTLIKPSHESIKSVQQSLKDCFEKHRGNELIVLIKDANAIIRGWCEYHKGAVSSEIFTGLNKWLYKMQSKWIKRRTPRLSNSARATKYWGKFNPERDDIWVFGDKKTGAYMLKFSWTKIQRHELIKFDYSPDNPDLKEYWDNRNNRISRTREENANTKFYFGILKDQHFLCPVCKQSLVFTDEVRHLHHIIPRSQNGGDDRRNLRYLHAPCHRKLHAIGANSLEAHKLLGLTEKSYAKLERINQEWWAKQSQDKKEKKK